MLVSSGNELLALDFGVVREVVPARPFARLPGSPAFVSGLINLRGRMVTVVDLGARLRGRAASSDAGHRVVVVEYQGREVGLAVHDVVRIVPVASEALTRLASDGADAGEAPFLTHAGELDGVEFRTVHTERLLRPIFG